MKFPRLLLCIGAALVMTLGQAGTPGATASAATHGYPRLAFYGSIRGNGFPFYNAPLDSALNDTTLNAVSRFDEIILDVNPIHPFRPEIITQLKARNPDAKVLGYVVGQDIWMAADKDSMRHYPTRLRRIITNNNAWLLSKRTHDKYFAGNMNLAKRNTAGDLFIADSIAQLWRDVTITPGYWDGIFYDILCDELSWSQAGGDSVDYVAAGYSSFDAFNQSWREATQSIATKMRAWGGPNFTMVGNCALGTQYGIFNGWMREGFPYQAGGDWYSNMFWSPGGYITDEQNFMAPRHNYIFSFQVGEDEYSDNNNRIMRYGLGSASLADGFAVFGGQDRDAFHADYHKWWYDEYAVDLTTGRASDLRQHTGWLGQPLTSFYQTVWIGNQPEGVTNPDFETSVTQGWGFGTSIPGTRTRDTTTAGHGVASVRIDIPQSNPVDWKVNLYCPLAIPFEPYNTYSVTMWVKASTPRRIPVIIAPTGGTGKWVDREIYVTTEWRQIQLPVYSGDKSGAITLVYYLATDAGSVWFDDVHVQKGTTTVYRRDFQNGSVLVNPSVESYMEVPMGRPFRRILGVSDPITNDGSLSDLQIVGASDALFLIGDDVTPPNRTVDLRQVLLRP